MSWTQCFNVLNNTSVGTSTLVAANGGTGRIENVSGSVEITLCVNIDPGSPEYFTGETDAVGTITY